MSFQISVPDHILFEDPYLLAINKPNGLMVEPDRNNHPNLLQQVRAYVKASVPKGEEVYAQHVHRLDRVVSGIILFVKQKSVLRNISEQFAERKVEKYYQALTAVAPAAPTGRLENWLRKEKKKGTICSATDLGAELALLEYQVEGKTGEYFLWKIALHTGKFHQIRSQLAYIGCPIIGDALYGSEVAYRENAIALHASTLIFHHPVSGEKIVLEKPIALL